MNDFSREDEQLRELLNDAVSDVEPGHGLDAIRARTAGRSRGRRTWMWGAGGAVLATAATVLGVAVLGNLPATTDREPGVAAGPTESAVVQPVPVYYVGDTSRGPRLFREFHQPAGDDALAQSLTEALTGGELADPDYRTDWPEGTTLESATLDDVIHVQLRNEELDLRERPAGMTAEEAEVAVQQLVFTAQAATGEAQTGLEFTQWAGPAGTPAVMDRLLGVELSDPVMHASTDDVFAQVWVIEPFDGASVTSPFEVTGTAAAFEATVVWSLTQGDKVVDSGFAMAREGGVRTPYSFTVQAPPGDYTLVVADTDPSGGEGFAPWQDTKQITVTD